MKTSASILFASAALAIATLGMTAAATSDNGKRPAAKRTLVVYYFHRTIRCASCNAIEKMTHDVLRTQFAKELKSGRIAWKPTNLDLEKTDRLETHYNIEVQTLILSDTRVGKERRWENLEKIWDLYHIEPEFKRYVAESVRRYLK